MITEFRATIPLQFCVTARTEAEAGDVYAALIQKITDLINLGDIEGVRVGNYSQLKVTGRKSEVQDRISGVCLQKAKDDPDDYHTQTMFMTPQGAETAKPEEARWFINKEDAQRIADLNPGWNVVGAQTAYSNAGFHVGLSDRQALDSGEDRDPAPNPYGDVSVPLPSTGYTAADCWQNGYWSGLSNVSDDSQAEARQLGLTAL